MYLLTKICKQPNSVAISLPGRSIHLSDQKPEAPISDEEYESASVQARIKLRHVKAVWEEGDVETFPTPDTLQYRQYRARLKANDESRQRAKGAL